MSTFQQPLGRHVPKTQSGPGLLRLCPTPPCRCAPHLGGGGWEPCSLLGPPPASPPPPPTEPGPTLADAVARGAAQVEAGLAAAVLRPLHLRTARRAAEGGVAGLAAVGGRCGEKTPSVPGPGAPGAPGAPSLGQGPGGEPRPGSGPFSELTLEQGKERQVSDQKAAAARGRPEGPELGERRRKAPCRNPHACDCTERAGRRVKSTFSLQEALQTPKC